MKRFAMTCMLKNDPESIRRYEEYHANPWPEVVQGCYKAGLRRAFIYRLGCQLFMFLETVDDFDMERDMPKYMENPRAKEWDDLMRTFQTSVPVMPAGSTWVGMKEIHAIDHAINIERKT